MKRREFLKCSTALLLKSPISKVQEGLSALGFGGEILKTLGIAWARSDLNIDKELKMLGIPIINAAYSNSVEIENINARYFPIAKNREDAMKLKVSPGDPLILFNEPDSRVDRAGENRMTPLKAFQTYSSICKQYSIRDMPKFIVGNTTWAGINWLSSFCDQFSDPNLKNIPFPNIGIHMLMDKLMGLGTVSDRLNTADFVLSQTQKLCTNPIHPPVELYVTECSARIDDFESFPTTLPLSRYVTTAFDIFRAYSKHLLVYTNLEPEGDHESNLGKGVNLSLGQYSPRLAA